MLRILSFLVLVFLLGLGFAWLAERPGTMLVTFDGYQYQVSLMVAAVLVTALVAAVMLSWWVLKSLWNSPYIVSRYFRVRRRDRGYQALSTGLIAAGAGDAEAARRLHKQTAKLISAGQEPLVHLLEAQASLLEGDHDAARRKFEAMLEDPEMRLIGLRGLYLEAERHGDRGVARHYAERANALAPQLAWATGAALEGRMSEADWDGALRILDARKPVSKPEREKVARDRACLLTAKAIQLLNVDPLAARNAAIEANRLDPTLVPAAVVAAKALFRQDDLRKGSKILEAAWKASPHPEIAEAYVRARPGDSALDRLKRARRLEDLRQNNVESSLAVARAALEAGELKEARAAADKAARMEPREAVLLLLADIEETETGDLGRVRELLARAVKAAPDPAWTADGVVAERWAPFSPVTGRIGAFEWRVPVERVGRLIEQQPQIIDGPAPALPTPEIEAATVLVDVPKTVGAPAPANDPLPPHREPAAPSVAAKSPAAPSAPAVSAVVAPAPAAPDVEPADADVSPTQPDDPGVSREEAAEQVARRFRLF